MVFTPCLLLASRPARWLPLHHSANCQGARRCPASRYNQEALAESVGETMLGLLGRPPATPLLDTAALPGHIPEPLADVDAAIQRVRALHNL